MKNSNWCFLGAEVAYTVFFALLISIVQFFLNIEALNWCFWAQKSLAPVSPKWEFRTETWTNWSLWE